MVALTTEPHPFIMYTSKHMVISHSDKAQEYSHVVLIRRSIGITKTW